MSQKPLFLLRCAIEKLEQRAMLSLDPIVGLGVLGDSLSDEYAGELHSYARNWVELLAEERAVNLGTVDDWGPPRREGYEYNWARVGADSKTMLSSGSHTGLAQQINDGLVSHAVMAVGQNDFFIATPAYAGIYSGIWSQSRIDAYTEDVLGNIHTALKTLCATDVDLVLSNIVDYGVAPLTRFLYSNPDRRDRVANVIDRLNDRIEVLARDYQLPMTDLFGFAKELLGTNQAPVPSHTIGGQVFLNQGGINPHKEFVFDGVHPHTVPQAIFANLFLEAFSLGHGTHVGKFTEAEMVGLVGLPYGGEDTLEIAYSDFVVLPTVDNPAGVGDLLWRDLDGNGIQDAGEPGVEGVRVELFSAGSDGLIGGVDDVSVREAITGADGNYGFTDLPAGTYYLEFSELPDGLGFTLQNVGGDETVDSDADPTTGRTDVFVLGPGQYDATQDAGLVEGPGPVQPARLVPDPDRPGEWALLVEGTSTDDRIVLEGLGGGDVRVLLYDPDGIQTFEGVFSPSVGGQIFVNTLEGNDRVELDSNIGRDANVFGGPGRDVLIGGSGNDRLDGGEGRDVLYGNDGNDVLVGGDGNDRIYGGAGGDELIGGPGSDLLSGDADDDVLRGGEHDDRLYGRLGDDQLFGGPGHDRLYGNEGNDSIRGDEGNDRLYGHRGDDELFGGPGHDRLYGHEGNDSIHGDEGNDRLYGDRGDDELFGGPGDDRLYGQRGNDLLDGGEGNDRLYGGLGDDVLIDPPARTAAPGKSKERTPPGGTTGRDAHDTALMALLAEWTAYRPPSPRGPGKTPAPLLACTAWELGKP